MTLAAKSLKNWLFFLSGLLLCMQVLAKGPVPLSEVELANLPKEARRTLVLVKQGGPFPYAKDGVVFGNYEGVLPKRKRGYYHEYTVPTPGKRSRGARRIIAGGDPQTSGEYFYTDDHYSTFRRIKE
jgi:ribonuclease T1